jgi:MFS transporter, DHA3 family, macrolide efflux protein
MTIMPLFQKHKQPTGMTAFTIVWVGQFVSLLGTRMTQFAITLWAWELTGQATALALVAFFSFVPSVILTPFAGTFIDRSNRKIMMMVSDLGAGLATIVLFLLSVSGHLAIWHIYATAAFASAAGSFQFPAYSSAISMMVDKKQYARTSAMLGLARSSSRIIAPIAAAVLYALIKIDGIFLIDIFTFTFAVLTLLFIHIPQPPPSKEGEASRGNFWEETTFGFRYIWQRPGLLGLQIIFSLGNFLAAMSFLSLSPMILARTGNDEVILASVMSALGIGGVIGGLVISTGGGPKRRVHGVLGGWFFSMFGGLLLGLGQVPFVWVTGAFILVFCTTFIDPSNQALWQSKVPPDIQGRVFAIRSLIAQISAPLAILSVGPLIDHVLEPAMSPDGALAGTFGPLVGTGAGAGMALIVIAAGILTGLVALAGYLIPDIRYVEDRIPDYAERLEQPLKNGGDIEAQSTV